MSGTARLSLPFLSPGQAQKEILHNEAIQALDFLVAGAVEEGPRDAPPTSPGPGECYVVSEAPTGAWAGKPQAVAGYTDGGWRFIAPAEGMSLYVKSNGLCANYRAGTWEIGALRGSLVVIDGDQVVGGRAGAIASPVGGTTIDEEARATIDLILAALRHHGLIAP